MPVIARGQDDLLLDRIVAALNAFSTAQAAMDSSVAFTAERERKRPARPSECPLVNVWIESDTPDRDPAKGREGQSRIRVNMDLLVRGDETPGASAGDPKHSDQVAARRLGYLKEQSRCAVFSLAVRNTIFPPADGVNPGFAHVSWPTYTANPEPSGQAMEQLMDGRWTFEVDVVFEVTDSDAPIALEQITATGGDPASPLYVVTNTYP